MELKSEDFQNESELEKESKNELLCENCENS